MGRVYTALQRDVHTADFIFNAVKNRQFPKETMHDVYCSECGKLTQARSRNNAEGGADDIASAGVRSSRYLREKTGPLTFVAATQRRLC